MDDDTRSNRELERSGHATAALDAFEAAMYLAIWPTDLSSLVKSGELPHTRVGSRLRIRKEDLDAYLTKNTSTKYEEKPGDALSNLKSAAKHDRPYLFGWREIGDYLGVPPRKAKLWANLDSSLGAAIKQIGKRDVIVSRYDLDEFVRNSPSFVRSRRRR